MWVATGSGTNNLAWSMDGRVWNAPTSGDFAGWGLGVAWNGSIWVAVGNGGGGVSNIKWSTDGKNWNNSVNDVFTTGGGYGVAWNGAIWVAVGGGTGVLDSTLWSTDGKNWNNILTSGGLLTWRSFMERILLGCGWK
jgi:hypothetical protein